MKPLANAVPQRGIPPGTAGVLARLFLPAPRSGPTTRDRARFLALGWIALPCLLWFGTLNLQAHTASTAWLTLSVSNQTVSGQWEIPLRDLDEVLGLDANDDGQLTWGELRARHTDLGGYSLDHLTLDADGRTLSLHVTEHRIRQRSDGSCAVVRFMADAPEPVQDLRIHYRLFFDRDPLHRGLVRFVNRSTASGSESASASVLSPDHPTVAFHVGKDTAENPFALFVREGMHHIWTGYDHLLFLLVLLLPSVLLRTGDGWRPEPSFRRALTRVLQIVTAFTVAHSLTLGLAAFDFVRLPSRLVESTIAASIVFAAVTNLWRFRAGIRESALDPRPLQPLFLNERPWLVPFVFGLVHGFGFAGVLAELGLSRSALGWPLLGFNLGVELGQLACVAGFLPFAFLLRRSRFYRFGALPVGSTLILLLAAGWFIERAFDLSFLPL